MTKTQSKSGFNGLRWHSAIVELMGFHDFSVMNRLRRGWGWRGKDMEKETGMRSHAGVNALWGVRSWMTDDGRQEKSSPTNGKSILVLGTLWRSRTPHSGKGWGEDPVRDSSKAVFREWLRLSCDWCGQHQFGDNHIMLEITGLYCMVALPKIRAIMKSEDELDLIP